MKDHEHDSTQDHGGHDEMTIRHWYNSATPPADSRQDAIDRLLQSAQRPHAHSHGQQRLWGVAAAAIAATLLLTISLFRLFDNDANVTTEHSAHGDEKLIVFEVRLPSRSVSEVALTGDFNGWSTDATPMHRQGSSDLWQTSIALPPGRHVYSFVVDGKEWVIDPLAPRAELDELGPANVIAIPGA